MRCCWATTSPRPAPVPPRGADAAGPTDGSLIHARVVSGEGYGAPGTSVGKIDPKTKKRVDEPADITARRHPIGNHTPEHSLLIIGFDGDKFVFHDPDAGVSKAGGEQGFGLLFLDSTENRLARRGTRATCSSTRRGSTTPRSTAPTTSATR